MVNGLCTAVRKSEEIKALFTIIELVLDMTADRFQQVKKRSCCVILISGGRINSYTILMRHPREARENFRKTMAFSLLSSISLAVPY